MFGGHTDDPTSLLARMKSSSEDGKIDAFGCPACKKQFIGTCSDQATDRMRRLFDQIGNVSSSFVRSAARVGEVLTKQGKHRLQNDWIHGCRGMMIQVDHVSTSSNLGSTSGSLFMKTCVVRHYSFRLEKVFNAKLGPSFQSCKILFKIRQWDKTAFQQIRFAAPCRGRLEVEKMN